MATYKVKPTRGSGTVIRTYACTSAGTADEHVFDVQLRSGEMPKFCPHCGFSVDQRSKPRPSKVSIGGKAIVRAVDMTYRALEEGSAQRAAAVGNPALKITNMKDRLREGDIAAVLPNNSVTQFMGVAEQSNIRYGFGGGSMGRHVSLNTRSPTPVPQNAFTGAGHVSLSAIQGDEGRTHQMSKMQAAVVGQINKAKQ
jgi:hypothetical protein